MPRVSVFLYVVSLGTSTSEFLSIMVLKDIKARLDLLIVYISLFGIFSAFPRGWDYILLVVSQGFLQSGNLARYNLERGHSRHGMAAIIVSILRHKKPMCSIILLIIQVTAEILCQL